VVKPHQHGESQAIAARHSERSEAARDKRRAQTDYAYFVRTYCPHIAPDDCAAFHTEAANAVKTHAHYHGLWQWFRGAAKSTHANVLLPLWLLIQDAPQFRFMLVVGQTKERAARQLDDLRLELEHNALLRQDFRHLCRRQKNCWARGYFALHNGPLFVAIGMNQSPRGLRHGSHRPDYIVADDLDHRILSRNPARVRAAAQWVMEDLLATQDRGMGRFILACNLFSKHTITHALQVHGGFDVRRVNAFDEAGQTTWPAKYGTGDFFNRQRALLGYRAFQREYMNNPLEEGAVFRAEWLQWAEPLPLHAYSALVCYIDPSFGKTRTSDFKAAKVWGLTQHNGLPAYHHLKSFVRQCSTGVLVQWCFDLYDAWCRAPATRNEPEPPLLFYLEGGFMQGMFIDAFADEGRRRGYALPLRPDNRRKPDKQARIEQMSVWWELGRVWYNLHEQQNTDMQTGLDQLLAFGPGSRAHDDGPDADEGALWLLQRRHAPATTTPIVHKRTTPAW
jgi:hypothetical protein